MVIISELMVYKALNEAELPSMNSEDRTRLAECLTKIVQENLEYDTPILDQRFFRDE